MDPPKQESPGTIASKIIDQTKKSGEFDKYRHELTNQIIESSEMQKLIEKCNGIIEEKLRSTSDADLQKYGITQIREAVKGEIKKRKLVDNMMNHVLNQHMQRINPILAVRMEEMVRAELGIPKEMKPVAELPDANLELIDMEVSSGGSGDPSTASNTPPGMNSPRTSGSNTSKRMFNNSPAGNNRSAAASTSRPSNHQFGHRKSSMISLKSHHDDHHNKIDVEFDDEEDASALLDKFADSISSACSSSLSCNASEDGLRPADLDQKSNSFSSSSSNKSSSSGHSSTANREFSSKTFRDNDNGKEEP